MFGWVVLILVLCSGFVGCVSSVFCGFAFVVDCMRLYSLHLFVGVWVCICFVALGIWCV